MDPDANMAEQREIAAAILIGQPADVERLAELVLALDKWLGNGGYPPKWGSV